MRQKVLNWLKINNPADSNSIISQDRQIRLPENAPIEVNTVETNALEEYSGTDDGPASDQVNPG